MTNTRSEFVDRAYSEIIPTIPGRYVYRLWAADGACLYVGCCGERTPRRVRTRFRAHRHDQPWWSQVVRIDVATFDSAAEMVEEEVGQIARLRPAHNKALLQSAPAGREGPSRRWDEWYAMHPDKLAEKRRRDDEKRPSGWKRAAIRKRRPAAGQQGLFLRLVLVG